MIRRPATPPRQLEMLESRMLLAADLAGPLVDDVESEMATQAAIAPADLAVETDQQGDVGTEMISMELRGRSIHDGSEQDMIGNQPKAPATSDGALPAEQLSLNYEEIREIEPESESSGVLAANPSHDSGDLLDATDAFFTNLGSL